MASSTSSGGGEGWGWLLLAALAGIVGASILGEHRAAKKSYQCPSCGGTVGYRAAQCPSCGRALKWS